jgi:putative peptidoglycan lipid II flippase
MSAQQNPGRLIRDSGRTTLLMGLGVIAKLVVDIVLIAGYGLSGATDAFFVAYTLLIIVEALIFPACQAGLVPIFVRASAAGGRPAAWALFNSLLTAAVVVSVALSAAAILASGLLVRALAPGLDAATSALAGRLASTMLLGLLFVAPIGVMRAFLNAHDLFGAPAAHELIRGVTVLAVVALWSAAAGARPIEAVAAGFAAAALVQAAVLAVVIARRLGPDFRPALDVPLLRSAGVERMLTIPLLDHAVGQGVLIAERVIGSFLPAGSISAISYGHRLASVIGNTLFTGVEVVSLASLSASLAGGPGRLREAYGLMRTATRLVVVLGLPVAAAVWALQQPLVALVFGRGDGAAAEVATVLGVYALGIPLYGYLLLARSFLFAQGRPQLSLAMAGVHFAVVALAAPALARSLGAAGVAWAFNAGQAAACVVGVLAIGRGPAEPRLAVPALVVKVGLAVFAMAAVMDFAYGLAAGTLVAGALPAGLATLPALGAACAAGGLTLLALLLALQVEEIKTLPGALLPALPRRGETQHQKP